MHKQTRYIHIAAETHRTSHTGGGGNWVRSVVVVVVAFFLPGRGHDRGHYILLRGAILNRTYGTHKTYIFGYQPASLGREYKDRSHINIEDQMILPLCARPECVDKDVS